MFLRNIDQENDLYNETRLQVNDMVNIVIFAIVIIGKDIGKKIFIMCPLLGLGFVLYKKGGVKYNLFIRRWAKRYEPINPLFKY